MIKWLIKREIEREDKKRFLVPGWVAFDTSLMCYNGLRSLFKVTFFSHNYETLNGKCFYDIYRQIKKGGLRAD